MIITKFFYDWRSEDTILKNNYFYQEHLKNIKNGNSNIEEYLFIKEAIKIEEISNKYIKNINNELELNTYQFLINHNETEYSIYINNEYKNIDEMI